jgi:hypothetical protein
MEECTFERAHTWRRWVRSLYYAASRSTQFCSCSSESSCADINIVITGLDPVICRSRALSTSSFQRKPESS